MREPIRNAMRFYEQPSPSRLLSIIAVIAALVIVAIVISEVAQIPPAHLIIIGVIAALIFWKRPKRRR